MQGWFHTGKSISGIHYSNRPKKQEHMTIAVDAGKATFMEADLKFPAQVGNKAERSTLSRPA